MEFVSSTISNLDSKEEDSDQTINLPSDQNVDIKLNKLEDESKNLHDEEEKRYQIRKNIEYEKHPLSSNRPPAPVDLTEALKQYVEAMITDSSKFPQSILASTTFKNMFINTAKQSIRTISNQYTAILNNLNTNIKQHGVITFLHENKINILILDSNYQVNVDSIINTLRTNLGSISEVNLVNGYEDMNKLSSLGYECIYYYNPEVDRLYRPILRVIETIPTINLL